VLLLEALLAAGSPHLNDEPQVILLAVLCNLLARPAAHDQLSLGFPVHTQLLEV
jgi:hypothetical protein